MSKHLKQSYKFFVIQVALILCLSTELFAQEKIALATIERKPFAFQDENGKWTGFTIELWENIAQELNFETSYREFKSFGSMLQAVEKGRVDAAAANISVTAAREQIMDFSRPIFDSGLTILAPISGSGSGSASIFKAMANRTLWGWIASAVLLFVVAGALIAYFERRQLHFENRGKRDSLREGFWWSVSVVTNASFTIFTPFTVAGRMLSYLLILIGLFLVSGFVAQITATLTVNELQSQISDLSDLRGKRIGTTKDSTTSRYLSAQSYPHKTFSQLGTVFREIEAGRLDAVVHDAPLLAYYAQTEGTGRFETVGGIFKPEKLGIALPQGSPNTEIINQQILRMREDGTYRGLLNKWFGSDYY